jgi:iron complex outermembrane receptor protein
LTDADGDGDPTNDRVPFGQSVIIQPLSGKYNTDEVFGELRAALIGPSNNVPLIYSLELQGAARYVDHSTAGGDLTWTAGASWQPIRDITIRGNYTRAIRAPFITEAFNPSSSFFDFADDPCDQFLQDEGRRRLRVPPIARPTESRRTSTRRRTMQFPASGRRQPEPQEREIKRFTIGAVLRPSFIPRLSLSVDYVDIKVRDVITQLGANEIVANCYDSADFPNSDFCDRFTRDATNQLDFISTGYFNAAELRYKGILAALDYRVPTPFLGPIRISA